MKFVSIIEYVETELRPFSEKPLGAVDSLVLSQFAYNELASVFSACGANALPLRDVLKAEHFPAMFAAIFEGEKSKRLLEAMAASPRFRDLTLSHYVSEYDAAEGKQFSAVCIRLTADLSYLAFRGTDDSLIGWKEDFCIVFKSPVPSQRRAAEYLADIAATEPGHFFLGGHSKGGNLAVYAAMCASAQTQERLEAIYDHDGPGFKEGVLDNDGYHRIKDRIQKTIPQSSLVGMLLDGHDSYTVVECRSVGGAMQHNPFMWEVVGGDFRHVEEVTNSAKYINSAVHLWIGGLSDADRESFVEALFDILDAGKAETITEITRQWRKSFAAMFAAMKTEPEMKKYLHALIRDFASLLAQGFRAKLPRRLGSEPMQLEDLK